MSAPKHEDTPLLERLRTFVRSADVGAEGNDILEAVAQIERLRGLLLELQWAKAIRGVGPCCPFCDGSKYEGHAATCRLDAALYPICEVGARLTDCQRAAEGPG